MGKLEDLSKRIDDGREQGDQIMETADEKIDDAENFKSALDSIEIVDEDTQDILNEGTDGASEVATEQGEQIVSQMEGVSEQLSEVSSEADESAETEHGNAEKISDAPGDYSSVASQAESRFEEQAANYEGVRDESQEINDYFK